MLFNYVSKCQMNFPFRILSPAYVLRKWKIWHLLYWEGGTLSLLMPCEWDLIKRGIPVPQSSYPSMRLKGKVAVLLCMCVVTYVVIGGDGRCLWEDTSKELQEYLETGYAPPKKLGINTLTIKIIYCSVYILSPCSKLPHALSTFTFISCMRKVNKNHFTNKSWRSLINTSVSKGVALALKTGKFLRIDIATLMQSK